jgi:leader peptidase (prepilin peptidase)/N-methyltransferase
VTVALIVAGVVLGLAVGPLLADVARRVFADPRRPLLERKDVAASLRFGSPNRPVEDRLVQVLSGVVFGATAAAVGWDFSLPGFFWFAAATLVLTLTDVDRKLIPNRITLPSGLIGGALLIVAGIADLAPERLLWMAIGSVGYTAFMTILALLVPGGLGFGDVKLAAILGGFLGYADPAYIAWGVIGAYVIGGAASLFLLITRIKSRKDTIPFGPYMVVGSYVALWFGEAITDWYSG